MDTHRGGRKGKGGEKGERGEKTGVGEQQSRVVSSQINQRQLVRRQETANREIRGEEDNGDVTSHNNTNKPACFTQLNSTAPVPWVNVRKQRLP